MWFYVRLFISALGLFGRHWQDLVLEFLVLRQQLAVYQRGMHGASVVIARRLESAAAENGILVIAALRPNVDPARRDAWVAPPSPLAAGPCGGP